MKQYLQYWAWGLVWLMGCLPGRAQAPAWQTLLTMQDPLNVPRPTTVATVTAVAADASGNVYFAGTFSGAIRIGHTILTSAGATDGFVAKWYNPTQGWAWAQSVGGTGADDVRALAVVGPAVYVAGSFSSSTATFGFNGPTLSNAGSGGSDGYVAKLLDVYSTGLFSWAQRVGGAGDDAATALAAAGTAVYVGGSFGSPAVAFGPTTLSTPGPERAYVARLTDDPDAGTSAWAWAVQNGGSGAAEISALALGSSPAGPVVTAAGSFEGTTTYGNAGYALSSAGGRDVLVGQLIDTGPGTSYSWATQAGGPAHDVGTAVAAAGGSLYVAGSFASPTSSFGSLALTNASPGGGSDAFVAKLTAAATATSFSWAQQIGGAGPDQANSLVVRGPSVYVVGSFGSATASFGSLALTNSSLPGFSDVFVARLLDAGSTSSFVWVQQAGGSAADYGLALAASGPSLYVGGSISAPATFGSLPVGVANGSSATPIIGFVSTLTDATGLATTPPAALAGVHIYPNPAHAAATIRLPAGPGPASLTLADALGRVVRTQSATTGTDYQLDLTGLAPGLYALRVQAGAAVATHQLVVE